MSDPKETPTIADEAAETIAPAEDAAPVDGGGDAASAPEGAESAGDGGASESAASSGAGKLAGSFSGHGLQIAGIAIFSVASLGTAVFFSGDITLDDTTPEERDREARVQEERERPGVDEIDPSLTGTELVRMGEAALDEGRFESARRLLDEARMRVDKDEVNLRIDLFSALARAEELAGRDDLSRLHRDYLSRLRESMGGSIKLFNQAELDFRQGRLREARQLYSKFLLRPADLEEGSERYLMQARDRLAQIMEREFAAASPEAMKMPLEPEAYFDD